MEYFLGMEIDGQLIKYIGRIGDQFYRKIIAYSFNVT